MNLTRKSTLILASATILLVGTGCATKRFVQTTVSPVEARVGKVEGTATQNTADIDQIEKQVSRVDEIASGADKQAKSATDLAKQAGDKAGTAGQRADTAYNLAEQAGTKATTVEKSVGELYNNIDNYQLLKEDNVQFGFNRAGLNDDAKAKLDAFAESIKPQKRYVVEVQGFTDPAGSTDYNLDLSRQRADSVVRYLTMQHQIPLRRINMLGVGKEGAVGDNKTREGRAQNRRVEVKVFALPEGKSDSGTAAPVATN